MERKSVRAFEDREIEPEIKEAILEFCEDHNICMDNITYAALRKDWFRYRKRCGNGGNFPVERENL